MEPARSFRVTVAPGPGGRVLVPIPFDPDAAWGRKERHHVCGTVEGMGVRAVVERLDDGWAIALGAAWRRACGIGEGDAVQVSLAPEGPQRGDLPDDFRSALETAPRAGAFFDSLAQFYRVAYLRWITATKRDPALRWQRISEVVGFLEDGIKQRPST